MSFSGAPIVAVPSLGTGVTVTTSSQPQSQAGPVTTPANVIPASGIIGPAGTATTAEQQQQQNALLKQLLSGSNASTTSTTTTSASAITEAASSSLEAQLDRPPTVSTTNQMPPASGGLTSLASAIPQPTSNPTLRPPGPQQVTQITIRGAAPTPMGQTTRLNLPTVPVPEASLRPQNDGVPNLPGQPQPGGPQGVPPRPTLPMQQGQMVMTRPGMPGQRPNLPQVPVGRFPQGQPGGQLMRPVLMNDQQQPGQPPGQPGQPNQSSQLQGLLQQQTLVPQNQLQQPQQQVVTGPQQQQPVGNVIISQAGQPGQPPQFSQAQFAIRGPHPRMRMVTAQMAQHQVQPGQPGGPRTMIQPGQVPQPQQQLQMQQQRFR